MLEVLHGGLMTTVQDLGRPGHFSVGIPASGATDSFSLKCGNLLVGNDPDEAGLEVLLRGLKVIFREASVIAITGADTGPLLNGTAIPLWETIKLKKNDILYFPKFPKHGCRSYLCIAGGINVPSILGSKSTLVEAGFGGFEGSPLKRGDKLLIGRPEGMPRFRKREMDPALIPKFSQRNAIRVIPGPQDHLFTKESIEAFLNTSWKVSTKANRTGVRFERGPLLEFKPRSKKEIEEAGGHVSAICPAGTPLGGIQVPLGSEIVIICRDGPTRGGYAKIATVIEVDMDKVGQLKPGDQTRFRPVDLEEAYSALEYDARLFDDLKREMQI